MVIETRFPALTYKSIFHTVDSSETLHHKLRVTSPDGQQESVHIHNNLVIHYSGAEKRNKMNECATIYNITCTRVNECSSLGIIAREKKGAGLKLKWAWLQVKRGRGEPSRFQRGLPTAISEGPAVKDEVVQSKRVWLKVRVVVETISRIVGQCS